MDFPSSHSKLIWQRKICLSSLFFSRYSCSTANYWRTECADSIGPVHSLWRAKIDNPENVHDWVRSTFLKEQKLILGGLTIFKCLLSELVMNIWSILIQVCCLHNAWEGLDLPSTCNMCASLVRNEVLIRTLMRY